MRVTGRLAIVLASSAAIAALAGYAVAGAAPTSPRDPQAAAVAASATNRQVRPAVPSVSGNVAGYLSTTEVTSASTTLTVPTITCGSAETDLGFGVWAYNGTTATTSADAQVDCESGTPVYYIAAYTPGGALDDARVSAGDVVIASFHEDGTKVTAVVHDVTAGATETSTGSIGSFDTAVLSGALNYASTIATFKTVAQLKNQVNGDYLTYTTTASYFMKYNKHVQIATGNLNTTGDGFALIFKNTI